MACRLASVCRFEPHIRGFNPNPPTGLGPGFRYIIEVCKLNILGLAPSGVPGQRIKPGYPLFPGLGNLGTELQSLRNEPELNGGPRIQVSNMLWNYHN